MKNTVIYHRADFDGLFCREIARKFLPPDTEFIGWHYGDDKIPFPPNGNVYILDLSPDSLIPAIPAPPDTDCKSRMIWIDHHKSAMDKYSAYIPGYRIDGVAACRLVWQWFWHESQGLDPHRNQLDPALPSKQEYIDRTVSEPWSVRLAGEYDIWDKRDPDAELFQHGLRSRELSPQIWQGLIDDSTEETLQVQHSQIMVVTLLESGRAIEYFQTKQNEDIISHYGFTIQFEGLTFLACNHACYNSHLFTAGLKPEHDASFGFKWIGKLWEVSLYHAPGKEQHDLSKIAVKYGGGGHRGACGFRSDSLPFL